MHGQKSKTNALSQKIEIKNILKNENKNHEKCGGVLMKGSSHPNASTILPLSDITCKL